MHLVFQRRRSFSGNAVGVEDAGARQTHPRIRQRFTHLEDLTGLLLTYEIKQHPGRLAPNFNVDLCASGHDCGIP